MSRRSNIRRALEFNPGTAVYLDSDRVYARELEVPSGGGVCDARSIAYAYSVFATEGKELGLRPETLELLCAPAVPSTHGFFYECLKGGTILAWLHETEPNDPIRWSSRFRLTSCRRLEGFRRSGDSSGLRIRDKQNGSSAYGDPPETSP
jgi:hypothetical protein